MRQKKTSHKPSRAKIVMIVTFFAGFLIMCYPFYINALNNFIDQQRINHYQRQNQKENAALLATMTEKNQRLAEKGISAGADPFDRALAGSDLQAILEQHLIGSVTIPKIAVELPLFDELNDTILDYGAGVLQGTSYPTGKSDTHSVISAHSGMPERKLFTDLEKLAVGDLFVLTVLGEKLAYEVRELNVVLPQDTALLKIEEGQDLVTLLTCTPYMINSHRLLVTGHRVPYTEEVAAAVKSGNQTRWWTQAGILAGTLITAVLLSYLLIRTIYRAQLQKRRIDLTFQLLTEDGQPQAAVEWTLYDRRGRKALTRNGSVYQVHSDSQGKVSFTDLPGGVYQIKAREQNWSVKAGITRKKQQTPRFWSKKRLPLQIKQSGTKTRIKLTEACMDRFSEAFRYNEKKRGNVT